MEHARLDVNDLCDVIVAPHLSQTLRARKRQAPEGRGEAHGPRRRGGSARPLRRPGPAPSTRADLHPASSILHTSSLIPTRLRVVCPVNQQFPRRDGLGHRLCLLRPRKTPRPARLHCVRVSGRLHSHVGRGRGRGSPPRVGLLGCQAEGIWKWGQGVKGGG